MSKRNENMKCDNCGYFALVNPKIDAGECRYDHPESCGWPVVNCYDWCADFEQSGNDDER